MRRGDLAVSAALLRCRRSVAWLRAYTECLREQRPISLVKTHWQVEGWLL